MNAADAFAAARSELYTPSPETVANATYPEYLSEREAAVQDPEAFWDACAREFVDWYEPYTTVLDSSNAPFYKWFVAARPTSSTTPWTAT